jgi:MFS family permease
LEEFSSGKSSGDVLIDATNLRFTYSYTSSHLCDKLTPVCIRYDLGVISGALPQLRQDFALSDNQQQWLVGILYLGGGLGAAVGGILCDFLGRKTGIVLCDLVFVLGSSILYWARDVSYLYIGRVVVGFGISVSGIADVAYLHELAPLAWRGAIVSVNEACISLGFLIAFAVNYALFYVQEGWRWMFGIAGWIAVVQLLLMVTLMPESPVWLQEQGRDSERMLVLQTIYGEEDLPEQLNEETEPNLNLMNRYNSDLRRRTSSSQQLIADDDLRTYEALTANHDSDHSRGYVKLLQQFRQWRIQGYIALFLSIAQQLSGQTAVLSYAPLIFAAIDENASSSTTLWIGLVKFAVTVLVIWKIEYLGRKFLLLTGMGILAIGQLLVAIAFKIGVTDDGGGDDEQQEQSGMWLALPGVLLVVMGYSASFGPLTWLLTSELFPTNIRGRALGTSTIVTYLFASLTTATFLSMQTVLGSSTVFALFALVTSLGMVFVYFAIPDTGGKTADQIDTILNDMWWWRQSRPTDMGLLETELT